MVIQHNHNYCYKCRKKIKGKQKQIENRSYCKTCYLLQAKEMGRQFSQKIIKNPPEDPPYPFGIEYNTVKLIYFSCIKCKAYLVRIKPQELQKEVSQPLENLPILSGSNYWCPNCKYIFHLEVANP